MIKKIISAAAILLAGSLVFAHFQMVYTPTSIIADDVKGFFAGKPVNVVS